MNSVKKMRKNVVSQREAGNWAMIRAKEWGKIVS